MKEGRKQEYPEKTPDDKLQEIMVPGCKLESEAR